MHIYTLHDPGTPGCLPPSTFWALLLFCGVTKQNQVHLFMFWALLIALLVLASSMANSCNWPSIKCHRQMLWEVGGQHPSIPVSRRKSEDWGMLWGRIDVAQCPKYWKTLSSAPVPSATTARKPMQILKCILLSTSWTSTPRVLCASAGTGVFIYSLILQIFVYISGTVFRHWIYKDKCKRHCFQGVSDLAKDTDVYIVY